MSDLTTMQVSIYRLDKSHFEEGDFIFTVNQVMQKAKSKGLAPDPQNLVDTVPDGFSICLFTAEKPMRPKWMDFFQPILADESILEEKRNLIHVFISFIGYLGEIYIITGGQINTIFERYVEQNFGLEIVMRLYKKDENVVRTTQDRSFTGNILGQTKFFRGDQKFSDGDRFGKIYKQVNTEVSKTKLVKRLGFGDHEIKREKSGCQAKSSFQLTKALNFNQLFQVIKNLTEIRKGKEEFTLNKVHLISRRKSRSVTDELDEKFMQQLFEKWTTGQMLDVDFCHSKFAEYLTASQYIIKQGRTTHYDDDEIMELPMLIRYLKNKDAFFDHEFEFFKHSMLENQLLTFDDNGNMLTHETLWAHVHGELEYKGKVYFRVDGEWYRIDPEFIAELNRDCEDIIKQCWDDELIKLHFDTGTEREFNQKFLRRSGCLVFDTVTHENIEICDILMYNKNHVHMIHVKQGFDNSIRELTSQISLAAKRLRRDIKSDFSYLDSLQDTVKRGGAEGTLSAKLAAQPFPPDGLKSIFSSKKNDNQIIFCFAFIDTARVRRATIKDNLSLYRSSIAKYSLLELHSQIISLGFGFKIIQLQKS